MMSISIRSGAGERRYRRDFLCLRDQLYTKLETSMRPVMINTKHVRPSRNGQYISTTLMKFRTPLSHKIWRRPGRYTQAGLPTFVSQMCREFGLWPHEVVMMTFEEMVQNRG
jgi:hypothetical protein